jgi:hypothetical protein
MGKLDLELTLAGNWDSNVNYTETNPEAAMEAQVIPELNYILPFSHHTFSVGYQATVMMGNRANARAFLQSPTASLSLDFPGGLKTDLTDIFSRVQNYRKEETVELTGPDYMVNQAGITSSFSRPGATGFNAYYQNTIYRYEPRGRDRNSDGNEVGGRVMVPVSTDLAILASGKWAEERVSGHLDRNFLEYQAGGGIHFSGPSRLDLDATIGFQSFDYIDDPNYEVDRSILVDADITAVISASVSAEAEVSTDARSNVAFSGSVDLAPRVNTTVHVGFYRGVLRTFYLDSKYYVDNTMNLMVRQQLFQRFTVYAESQYSLDRFNNSGSIGNIPARQDTRWRWRTGIEYAMGTWIELGLRGEYQKRDSNISMAYTEYQRTVIGFSATFSTP